MKNRRLLAHALSVACRARDNHPFHVAIQTLMDDLREEGFILALLHDSVEDDYLDERELRLFPLWVQESVEALTRREGEEYFDYIDRFSEGPEIARKVKLSDLRVNLERCVVSKNYSLARRYEKALDQLGGTDGL